jgi:hypothetical protein
MLNDSLALSTDGRPRWWQPVASFVALMLVVLAAPLFVLGLPLALAWRGVLAAAKWRAAPAAPAEESATGANRR